MSNDRLLPEGIRVFDPHVNAPDFVKASIVITPNDLYEFCKAHPEVMSEYQGKKQIRLQLLVSRDGKQYLSVDNYKAGEKKPDVKAEESSDLPF